MLLREIGIWSYTRINLRDSCFYFITCNSSNFSYFIKCPKYYSFHLRFTRNLVCFITIQMTGKMLHLRIFVLVFKLNYLLQNNDFILTKLLTIWILWSLSQRFRCSFYDTRLNAPRQYNSPCKWWRLIFRLTAKLPVLYMKNLLATFTRRFNRVCLVRIELPWWTR